MGEDQPPDRPPEAAATVGLTGSSRQQMERFRTAHATQVLTIFLSDLEGSTRQQSALGNVRAAELVKAHREVFRSVLARLDGEEVETAGDSFLVVFATPSEGVKFALRMQAAMRKAREGEPDLPGVRVGIHQGQVVVERHEEGAKAMDIYGVQVSTAARVTDLARGGQVLCTRTVFDDARAILRAEDFAGLSAIAWRNHGPYNFKGVEDAYEVCEVGEEGLAPLAAPPATAKGWPAGQADEELGWRPAVGVTVPETNWVLQERLGAEKAPGPLSAKRFTGAFGEVWKAWNAADKSFEVFKFCFKRDRLPALKREARLLKRLRKYRHPSLVEVYDVTERDRPPYYLEMEYVAGPTLGEWLGTDPPLGERLELVAQVADALDTVHAAGIYHRDIKPSNILLTRREDGTLQAKLTDFGLGAAEDKDLLKSISTSRADGVVGTWDYIAPELRRGGQPSAQSDLYSLGLTLYQMVVGDLARPLSDWEHDVESEVLREDIHRCIATDPAQRWRRAADLARALRSHDERLRQRQLEREREAQRRRAARFRAVSSIAAAVAVVVALLGIYAWHQRGVANQQRAEARRHEGIAKAQRDEAVRARERAEELVYYSNVLLCNRYIAEHRFHLARKVLWDAAEERRTCEWGLLLAQCYEDLTTLRGRGRTFADLALSPDGTRVLAVASDGTGIAWDLETGQQLATLEGHSAEISSVEFSPDGARALTGSADGTARVWDVATGRQLLVLKGHHAPFFFGAANDPRLADASEAHIAEVSAAAKGTELPRKLRECQVAVRVEGGPLLACGKLPREDLGRLAMWLDRARSVVSAHFSHDGSRILTASADGTARVWDAATGGCLVVLVSQARTSARLAAATDWRDVCARLRRIGMTAAAFHPQGTLVAAAEADGTAELWSVPDGQLVARLVGHGGEKGEPMRILKLRFSADGSRVLTASEDKTARIWDARSGRPLASLEGAEPMLDARFALGGALVVTAQALSEQSVAGQANLSCGIWDAATAQRVASFRGQPAALSRDGSRLALLRGGGVAVVDLRTCQELVNPTGHSDLTTAAAFLPDASAVVTASYDGTVRLWDARRALDPILRCEHPCPMVRAELRGDGRHVLGVSADFVAGGGKVVVWDAAAGRELLSIPGRTQGFVQGGELSPDGARFVALTQDEGAGVWDIAARRLLYTLGGHGDRIYCARFSPDGSLVATGSNDGAVHLWHADTGRRAAALTGHTDSVWTLAFSPDGTRVAAASSDYTARVWDAKSGAPVAVLRGHKGSLHDVSFSPDGARVATTAQADNTARVWEAASGRLLATMEGHESVPRRALFSPDGTQLLTFAGDKTARLWDAATGAALHILYGHATGVYDAWFSPDGARVLTAGDSTARLWDTASGRELIALRGHTDIVYSAAFAPDGCRVVTSSHDGTVRLWQPAPFRLTDLPGNGPMSWEERFQLWRDARYRAWRQQAAGPARRAQ